MFGAHIPTSGVSQVPCGPSPSKICCGLYGTALGGHMERIIENLMFPWTNWFSMGFTYFQWTSHKQWRIVIYIHKQIRILYKQLLWTWGMYGTFFETNSNSLKERTICSDLTRQSLNVPSLMFLLTYCGQHEDFPWQDRSPNNLKDMISRYL